MKLEGRRESSNVDDRRRSGSAGKAAGMGIGGLVIVALITLVMGGNPLDVLQQAGGLTYTSPDGGTYEPTAEEEELAKLLKEIPGYKTVSVEVSIVGRSFSVIGAQSGRYMINKEKMTIFEALAMVGDLAEFNSRKEIKLVREKEGVTTIKTFDVRSKDIVNSEFYYIEPNDIIYIRQIPGYSFGINSASTALGVTATTLSFGVFVYSIVQTGINHVNKHYGNGGAQ